MVTIPMHHRGTLLTVGNRLVPIDFTGLVGLWTFGEGSGTTLYDRSGNGNNGTINGATWQWDLTRKKYVLSFDGTDDYVDIGDPAVLRMAGDQTWIMFFKSTMATGQAEDMYAIDKYDHVSPMTYEETADALRPVWWSGGSAYVLTYGWGNVNDGNWHMAVWRYEEGVESALFVDDMTNPKATDTTNTGALDTPQNYNWNFGRSARAPDYFPVDFLIILAYSNALPESKLQGIKAKIGI